MGGIYPKPTPAPEFNLSVPRFDQSTFAGRWMTFQQSTDFRTLFIDSDTIQRSLGILDEFKKAQAAREAASGAKMASSVASLTKYTNDELWEARRVVEATCHPETNEPIFSLVRFAAFAPANIPICTLLIWPNPSPALAIFGQWVNQSYNVAVNYANRNMSNPMPMEVVASSYALAVATSCGIAVGMGRQMAKRGAKLTPLTRAAVPWAAVVASGCVNVAFVRWQELTDGIEVESEDGSEVYGRSKNAGRNAIAKCCAARAIWSTPIIAGTPFLVSPLHTILKSPGAKMVSEIAVLSCIIWAVMPAALAVFPQRDSMSIEDMEPEIQAKVAGRAARVYFNKGL